MSLPKISVAIPAYNAERYIHEAIASIVAQDYPGEIEIIVAYVKGSKDKTKEILNNFHQALPLNRSLLIFEHEHPTPFRARIYCLEKFTGEYLHLFDYDNIMPPNRISKVVEHINKSHADFLFSSRKFINSNGFETGEKINIDDPYNISKLIKGITWIQILQLFLETVQRS